ncbi:MAG: HNH endonuclease [Clostridia bacterium]|nr:HNH endonuclease [Clostridia bacterium]
MLVYVLSKQGRPLMPCSPRKARLLLNNRKAKVVKRTPFTIQLQYGSTCYTQEVILGVDAGSKIIGLSASSEKEELFVAEVAPRNDVVVLLSTRRAFRRARRNRTTRYRQPRFDNRVHGKKKGWLAPSVEVKIQEHITPIKRVCAILPITKVVVETAEFDLQLIKAIKEGKPVPAGEDYQKGEMLGHYNVRQYVLWRDHYTCQCCGAHGKNIKLHVHHLESRKTGGNAPDNETTLCENCHEKLHKKLLTEAQLTKFKWRKRCSTRDAAFMGIMRKALISRLHTELIVPVRETHGYETKYTRNELLKLKKSHTNDALAITQGRCGFQNSGKYIPQQEKVYQIKPVRHHNRQLHRATILKGGIRKKNQSPTYVKGFRLFDKVRYQNQECFIWGRRTGGAFLLKYINGTKVQDGVGYKHLHLLERNSNYLIS